MKKYYYTKAKSGKSAVGDGVLLQKSKKQEICRRTWKNTAVENVESVKFPAVNASRKIHGRYPREFWWSNPQEYTEIRGIPSGIPAYFPLSEAARRNGYLCRCQRFVFFPELSWLYLGFWVQLCYTSALRHEWEYLTVFPENWQIFWKQTILFRRKLKNGKMGLLIQWR